MAPGRLSERAASGGWHLCSRMAGLVLEVAAALADGQQGCVVGLQHTLPDCTSDHHALALAETDEVNTTPPPSYLDCLPKCPPLSDLLLDLEPASCTDDDDDDESYSDCDSPVATTASRTVSFASHGEQRPEVTAVEAASPWRGEDYNMKKTRKRFSSKLGQRRCATSLQPTGETGFTVFRQLPDGCVAWALRFSSEAMRKKIRLTRQTAFPQAAEIDFDGDEKAQ